MNPRALIAEDEPVLRAEGPPGARPALAGVVVGAEVGDGLEAARVLEEQRPDILFLDVAMPGLDGLVARRASGRSHVVFITAYDEHAVPAFDEARWTSW